MTLSLSHPQSPAVGPSPLFTGISARFVKAIRAMQYARMREALNQMTDEQLAAIDLARADIPRRARQCVYDRA